VAHGADAAGNKVLTKKLRREEVHAFFASLPPCFGYLLASIHKHICGDVKVRQKLIDAVA
jgi:hypothetical protein